MTSAPTFDGFISQLREFMHTHAAPAIERVEGSSSGEGHFERLALNLFALQFQHNAAYRRFCERRGVSPASVQDCRDVPAIPTSAFKELELTSLSRDERAIAFHSSGTTGQQRSRHFHSKESLAIYEASLLRWFERHVLGDVPELVEEQLLGPLDRMPMLALTPSPEAAIHSSLAHMFGTVQRELGARDSLFTGRVDDAGNWVLDFDATLFAIRKSMCANRPLLILGTAFNFVHLLDHFAANNMRYRLARGSRVLETGGYKGQSREVARSELHALITRHLGIPADYIVTEYGMSELSSQAYDRVAGRCSADGTTLPRHFQFPPWARAAVISPETEREVADGETGLLRVYDLANVRSVMAVQTEDLAVRRGNGFELIGRATGAEQRGCSLMSAGIAR